MKSHNGFCITGNAIQLEFRSTAFKNLNYFDREQREQLCCNWLKLKQEDKCLSQIFDEMSRTLLLNDVENCLSYYIVV